MSCSDIMQEANFFIVGFPYGTTCPCILNKADVKVAGWEGGWFTVKGEGLNHGHGVARGTSGSMLLYVVFCRFVCFHVLFDVSIEEHSGSKCFK